LTTLTSFPCKDPSWAIRCRYDRGPEFGDFELIGKIGKPFNRENGCILVSNFKGYNIPCNSEGINMLTNQKCIQKLGSDFSVFTISEIEVWGII
jgi:hypothetical protein